MDLAWLSLFALIAVVAVSCTSRVNPGVVAIALAWGLVLWFGEKNEPQFPLKALWANFPADLLLTLLGVSLLFAQAEANGTLASVSVRDQGVGISAEEEPHIWAPFSISVAPILRAVLITPDSGDSSCPIASSSPASRLRGCGANGIAGGPSGPASIIDSMTRTSAMPSA